MVLSLLAPLIRYRKAALWGLAMVSIVALMSYAYVRHVKLVENLIAETQGAARKEMLHADLERAAALRNRVADGRATQRLRPTAPEGDQRGYRD